MYVFFICEVLVEGFSQWMCSAETGLTGLRPSANSRECRRCVGGEERAEICHRMEAALTKR